jgi:hypothetical protein
VLVGVLDERVEQVDAALDGTHQEALATAPVAEQPHGQRRRQVPCGNQVSEGVGLRRDADEVLAGVDLVRGVRRHVDRLARVVAAQPSGQGLLGWSA